MQQNSVQVKANRIDSDVILRMSSPTTLFRVVVDQLHFPTHPFESPILLLTQRVHLNGIQDRDSECTDRKREREVNPMTMTLLLLLGETLSLSFPLWLPRNNIIIISTPCSA